MKPIFRKISALGAATLLLAVVALLACQDSSAARVVADPGPVRSFLALTGTPGAGAALTPTPTFRPTELAPTPADLDRSFEDTRETRDARKRLVESRIVPVVSSAAVLQAMRDVPRHAFVPTRYLDQAYEDHPLPIGYGQTISQPSLVAMMTEMLELEPGDRVLEIGTGSGYQAAILRALVDEVYTIEIVPELAGIARGVFDQLGYEDVHTTRADGYFGWWEHAPFDAIIVTAAPDHLPAPLVAQLDPDGGRMVIPIGPPGGYQSLWLIVRNGEEIDMQRLFDVAFVPFTREGE
ncbi:MAG TPA: protein-L-isoaspartate(D-aspartate) O-methyltransferase [Aggregatilineaceae bacterium]|nr:protein-L-isoaspartate(D-aspartate) O-methyltransferase [Aggregatilineaceae bacterium]